MNILITGGLGYVGYFTIRELIKDHSNNITVIDDFSNNQNIKYFKKFKIDIVKSDFSSIKILKKLFSKKNFDMLIHLASYKKVQESIVKPKKYHFNNVAKTKKLINYCISRNLKKVIFSSSASVYGRQKNVIVKENLPMSSLSPYAKNKIDVENFLQNLIRKKKIKCIILRYFNIAGSISKNKNAFKLSKINNFIHKVNNYIKLNKVIPIFGYDYPTQDGTAIRDYIHIEDVAKINSIIVNRFNFIKTNTINIGSGKGTTLLEVIKIFKKNKMKKINLRYCKRKKGDIDAIVADNKKMKEIFKLKSVNKISKIINSL